MGSVQVSREDLGSIDRVMSQLSATAVGKKPIQLKQAFKRMSPEKAGAIKRALASSKRDTYVNLVSDHLADALLGSMKGVPCFGGNQALAREYFKNKLDPTTSDVTLEDFGLSQLAELSTSLKQLMGTENIEVKSVKCTGCSPVKCELAIENKDQENPVTVKLPQGMVLEQQNDERHEQTVGLCKDTVVVIPRGATSTFTVKGYCLNRGEGTPSGSLMNITGLKFDSIAEIDATVESFKQSAVWKKVADYRAKLKTLRDSHISAETAASAAGII
jgi:hypothetical protein